MKYYSIQIGLLIAIVSFSVTACGVLDRDDEQTKRTYPEALELETVTLRQLQNEVVPPDSLNIEAYVINQIICPPNAQCFLPDGIIIAEAPDDTVAENHLMLVVSNPQQFDEKKQYTFSIDLDANNSGDRKRFRLLGYSKINYQLYD